MHFALTKTAKILSASSKAASVENADLAQLLVKVYDAFSSTIGHDMYPMPPWFLQDNLNIILDELRVYKDEEREVIEKVLRPISRDENGVPLPGA
ncbi:hypothetical protein V9T40_001251 [Parthenolecanium corni]|uniref:Uncharacterized protein n=1 Tax=Parthenolecanium corni TaxID=536013 RepID=A0AAN9TB32_9HEMI